MGFYVEKMGHLKGWRYVHNYICKIGYVSHCDCLNKEKDKTVYHDCEDGTSHNLSTCKVAVNQEGRSL